MIFCLREDLDKGKKLYFYYETNGSSGSVIDKPLPGVFDKENPDYTSRNKVFVFSYTRFYILKRILEDAQSKETAVSVKRLQHEFNIEKKEDVTKIISKINKRIEKIAVEKFGISQSLFGENLIAKCKNGYYSTAIGQIKVEEDLEMPDGVFKSHESTDGVELPGIIPMPGFCSKNNNQNSLKTVSEKCFLSVVKDLNIISQSDNNITCLNIVRSWLPSLSVGQKRYCTLSDYIFDLLQNNQLAHIAIYSEPGGGKTYSFFDTYRELINNTINSFGKPVIPIFISSMLMSIYGRTIKQYISEKYFCGDNTQMEYALRNRGNVHFVLLVDALNEGLNNGDLINEVILLSVGKTNTTLIVSSNHTDEISTLKNSGFIEVRLNQLDAEIVENELKYDIPTVALKNLLCKPFYLKNYLENCERGGYTDEYSVIEAYIQNCKKNGKVSKINNAIEWGYLLDQSFPEFCYSCTIGNQMFVPLDKIYEIAPWFHNHVSRMNRLEQIGIIKKLDNAVYFVHEIYRDYFAAKHIYNKLHDLCIHLDAPSALKLELIRKTINLIQKAPVYVLKILAPKLYNEGILSKLLKEFGPLINKKSDCYLRIMFFREIVNLFSFVTNTLDGLDFHGANLWLTDFTKFDRIINCNFRKANLNPETLWLHHAKIKYTANNSGRICNDLIFLSGPEGFEVYNWKNDKQLFIKLPDGIIPNSWTLSPSWLIVQTASLRYSVSIQEIENRLYSNTITDGEDLYLSERYVLSDLESKNEEPIQPILKNNNGDELLFTPGKELFVKAQGKATQTLLSGICNYATFFDVSSNFIFADCDGVYMKISTEGALSWMRMIKPIYPNVWMSNRDSLVIKMQIPGTPKTKHFLFDCVSKKMSFIDTNEVSKLEEKGFSRTKEALWKECVEDMINVKCRNEIYRIWGGAIDFTNSVFTDATIISRKINEKERIILLSFGGII